MNDEFEGNKILYSSHSRLDRFICNFTLEKGEYDDGSNMVEIFCWILDEKTGRKIKLDSRTIELLEQQRQLMIEGLYGKKNSKAQQYPPLHRY